MAEQKVKIKKSKSMQALNKIFLESAADIASRINAKRIFLYADLINDYKLLKELSKKDEFVFITKNEDTLHKHVGIEKNIIDIPSVEFSRIGLIKIAAMKGLFSGIVEDEDKIVFITGTHKIGSFDSIIVVDIGKEFEILASSSVSDIAENLKPEVFEAVLNLSLELASQGREGKPVGTIFVIGDHEKVLQLSRQMIINPFQGYPEEERNIMDPALRETIKEFSAVDGAFVIREDGVVMAAGRHLSAALEKEDFPHGLGSRHVAAAGITSVTDAAAIVISESTGEVRIFKKGNIFMEIEKPVK
ncbi:MAG: DNA integrity scanning protein DisA nucleotide-binding domain protein [Nitrospinae bacterium]|nr:DNA integrity scanning protein DisA nucleotide-binding domain protein [Nitrospinota bacterium]